MKCSLGVGKLTRWHQSGSLTPCSQALLPISVNNDYVTAEIICSTAHVPHKVPASSQDVCSMPLWVPRESGGIYWCTTAVSIESVTRGEDIVCLLLWLLRQQERINISAVQMAPESSSLLVRASPALGSGIVWAVWRARQLVSWTESAIHLVSPIFLKRSLVFPILLFSSISLYCSLKKAFLVPLQREIWELPSPFHCVRTHLGTREWELTWPWICRWLYFGFPRFQ